MTKKPTKPQAPSTQQHVNVVQVKQGIIVTRTGSLRQVLKVEPVNFALKSDQDKEVMIGQYQNFINSLTFPIQIVIHSRRLDVTPYLHRLSQRVAQEPNELLQLHAYEYIDFVSELTSMTNIMDKKFYVVVGYEPPPTARKGFLSNLFGKKQDIISFTETDWQKHAAEMGQHVGTIAGGLAGLGLKVDTLDTQEAIELLYGVYNPEEATSEKLTEVESMQSSVVSLTAQGAPTQPAGTPVTTPPATAQPTGQGAGVPVTAPPQPAPTGTTRATITNKTTPRRV